MKRILEIGRWLTLFSFMIPAGIRGQEPLTLRQAIQVALKQSPAVDAAKAGVDEAKANAFLARTQYLPQVNFEEDMSRGDDPVYVFGTRLRQQRFTQTDFALPALNNPDPIGNFATRISGGWLLFDSLHTQKLALGADLLRKSADSSAEAANQKVVLDVVQAYQGVLYAERRVVIAQHELETAEALLSSVDDHVKAGLAVESDRMSAEVSVAARKQGLIAAHGDVDLGWAQLQVAMGTPEWKASAYGITSATAEKGRVPLQYPGVTVTVAKRKGTNATDIANAVLKRIDEMKGVQIPKDVHVTTTRNYGDTAKAKSDELLEHLLLATLSVTLLVALFLGWRESGVVLLAIPVTLALTMSIFYFLGYTINRVTLFALIFSIGILVDDAIVVVENIVRHFRLPENQKRSCSCVTVEAVAEVGNPTILATFAVIAAVLPMAFVRGLMGPYMRPIPVGASAAMLFSLMVAFMVSPWAAMRLLGKQLGGAHFLEPEHENWRTRLYRKVMSPLIASGKYRLLFFVAVLGLLLLSVVLVPLGLVRVKMLPFDNKSELQVIVNMPDGTPLEQTLAVTQALGNELARQPDVLDYQLYAGTSGPYNFNGLVRHYYMRRMPNQADIQVNLVAAKDRHDQSHAIARRLRPILVNVGNQFGARIQVSEVPPGPPVIQTLVAEVYGPDLDGQRHVAQQVKRIFQHTPGVVDTDWYVEDPQPQLAIHVDAVKAAQNGIAVAEVANALAVATSGTEAGLLHDDRAREPIPTLVQFTRVDRSSEAALKSIHLPGANGVMVPLGELITFDHGSIHQSIYHKNLRRVVYVTGDVAGTEESPVYAILRMNKELDQFKLPAGYTLARYNAALPESTDHYSMKWDGEWHITIEVFRDLGLAFAAVLILIYVLVVGWFRSFVVPLIIMAPIPLTLVGILPAHALMGAFFTATSMIGFIAGAGIIVRNSIILVDFIELRRRQGAPLAEAVIDAGAIRFRPMLLTAAAVVVGASVILTDPIFEGLAVSLIAGAVASTFLSWPTIPMLYYLVHRKSEAPLTYALEIHEHEGVTQ